MTMYHEDCRKVTALLLEARRRDMTYGQLVAQTTAEEQREIIRRYLDANGYEKKRRRKKKA